jgi:hypothetical protein
LQTTSSAFKPSKATEPKGHPGSRLGPAATILPADVGATDARGSLQPAKMSDRTPKRTGIAIAFSADERGFAGGGPICIAAPWGTDLAKAMTAAPKRRRHTALARCGGRPTPDADLSNSFEPKRLFRKRVYEKVFLL